MDGTWDYSTSTTVDVGLVSHVHCTVEIVVCVDTVYDGCLDEGVDGAVSRGGKQIVC